MGSNIVSVNFNFNILPSVETSLNIINQCFYNLKIIKNNTESIQMSHLSTIHMNDAGVLFVVTINDSAGPVNLSSAQSASLVFGKPDRSTLTVPCVITGTLGVINYISQADDFNQFGKWRIQAVIKFSDTNLKHSDTGIINVLQNIV